MKTKLFIHPLGIGSFNSSKFNPASWLVDVYANEDICCVGLDYCGGLGPHPKYGINQEDVPVNKEQPICPYCLDQVELDDECEYVTEEGFRLVRRMVINPFIGFKKQLKKLGLELYHVTDYVIPRIAHIDIQEIVLDIVENERIIKQFTISEEYELMANVFVDYRPTFHVPENNWLEPIVSALGTYHSSIVLKNETESLSDLTPDDMEFMDIHIAREGRMIRVDNKEIIPIEFEPSKETELNDVEYDVVLGDKIKFNFLNEIVKDDYVMDYNSNKFNHNIHSELIPFWVR